MGAGQAAQRPAAARHVALLAVLLPVCCRAAPERLRYAIPEETGSGSVVGPLARDLGLSPAELPARQLRLVSAAKRHLKHFAVSAEDGHLYVSERLDREEMCGDSASCSVSFEAVVQNPLNVFHVDVAIQDINDNSPVFSKAALDLEIGEWLLPGARFPLEMAQDPDVGSNSLLSYQLTENPSFSLAVKESPSGKKQPELVLEAALDREQQSSFQMVLTAVDGGAPARSGTVQIRINVTDANDNAPVFSRSTYEARVRENLPAGSLVLQVRATDADAGSNGRVSYSFSNVPQAVRAVFSVDSDSGDIRNEAILDFEERNEYTFGVEARDGGGLSGHCQVRVEITDENDNAPEITTLSVWSPVPEDAPPGTVVALLNVHDADSGDNGKVRCELDGESPFAVVASSGSSYKVVTASLLDRERAAEHNVTVVASDRGSPALSSRSALALAVSDVNDNAPVFEEAAYSAYVAENNAAGAAVLRVRARDADAGANGRVSYWLVGGSAGEAAASYVSVEARSGALYAQRSFDYEQCRELAVEVRAQDGGSPARSSTATVRVFVVDRNDNAPQVLWPAASASSPGAGPFEVVPRSAEAGYLVAKVVAVDADSGRNAWLSYELVQATEPALFRLGLHSGEVRTARAVSERDAARQRLVVVVKDHGQPALSATATLHVVLAESLQEALPALSERAAGAEAPADLQFYLVLALALLSALFVLSVALAVAARVRRAGPPAVLRCLGAERFSVAGPAFPADFCEGTLPYSYNLCVAPGRAVAECALLPAPLPARAVEDLLSGEPPAMLTSSSSRAPAEPPSDADAVQVGIRPSPLLAPFVIFTPSACVCLCVCVCVCARQGLAAGASVVLSSAAVGRDDGFSRD
ncbi:protocadherin gamma-B5-like [Dromaius novaehollandiae]|uniref:protocadherin gamma-B5-like n=1 Tax=Dromaius novaehollandiae TaxID=8790 RepID=UPI0031202931